MTKFEMYVAGDSSRHKGPGGWATIIPIKNKQAVVIKGGEYTTVEDRMDILGVIEGLKFVKLAGGTEVKIYTKSPYVQSAISKSALGDFGVPKVVFKDFLPSKAGSTDKGPLDYPELIEECMGLINEFDEVSLTMGSARNTSTETGRRLAACIVLASGVHKEREFDQAIDTVGMASLGL